jgi:hypothetical protein
MKLSRSTLVAVIAIFTVGAVGSTIATGAGKKKVRTKVTITHHATDYGDKFAGKVKAKSRQVPRRVKRKCQKRRKVVVFHKVAGGKERVGATRTNRRGRWVRNVGGEAEPGKYFAKAKRKTIKKQGKKIVCKKGKSKRIAVS